MIDIARAEAVLISTGSNSMYAIGSGEMIRSPHLRAKLYGGLTPFPAFPAGAVGP